MYTTSEKETRQVSNYTQSRAKLDIMAPWWRNIAKTCSVKKYSGHKRPLVATYSLTEDIGFKGCKISVNVIFKCNQKRYLLHGAYWCILLNRFFCYNINANYLLRKNYLLSQTYLCIHWCLYGLMSACLFVNMSVIQEFSVICKFQ